MPFCNSPALQRWKKKRKERDIPATRTATVRVFSSFGHI
uniref:Uncharacterized protein n=1 Tax=Anguilla anguilla TaxID=7936 RepID=A0A0E9XAN5_ANGAN